MTELNWYGRPEVVAADGRDQNRAFAPWRQRMKAGAQERARLDSSCGVVAAEVRVWKSFLIVEVVPACLARCGDETAGVERHSV